MTKAELISVLASRTVKLQKKTQVFLEAFTSTVTEALKRGDKLTLVGFGTFDVQNVPTRTGRNSRTGEPLQIEVKKKPNSRVTSGSINQIIFRKKM